MDDVREMQSMRAFVLGAVMLDVQSVMRNMSPEPARVSVVPEYDQAQHPVSLLVSLASGLQFRVSVDAVPGDE